MSYSKFQSIVKIVSVVASSNFRFPTNGKERLVKDCSRCNLVESGHVGDLNKQSVSGRSKAYI